MRICKVCGSDGPFPKIGAICKKCDAARKAEWYQKKKAGENTRHPPRPSLTSEQEAVKREKKRQVAREYYSQHRDASLEYSRQWHKEHHEQVLESARRYQQQQSDAEKRKARNARHRIYNKTWREKRKKQKGLSREQIGETVYDPNDGFLAFLMEAETE